jgi:hypothetical protein
LSIVPGARKGTIVADCRLRESWDWALLTLSERCTPDFTPAVAASLSVLPSKPGVPHCSKATLSKDIILVIVLTQMAHRNLAGGDVLVWVEY